MKNKKSVKIYFSPCKKLHFQNLRSLQKKKNRQQVLRSNNKIIQLKFDLNLLQNKINEMSSNELTKRIEDSGIPKCQSELIHEIFAAAKYKNPKNRHYSESWMILCLLFQIR